MADSVRKVDYAYMVVPSRAGQGAKVLGALKAVGVNMIGYSGFPLKGGKAQLDIVTDRLPLLRRMAKHYGWKLSKFKKGFWINGPDKVGAVHRHVLKLGEQGISVTAANAVSAGKGRYGMLLWVKEKDHRRAARALRAR